MYFFALSQAPPPVVIDIDIVRSRANLAGEWQNCQFANDLQQKRQDHGLVDIAAHKPDQMAALTAGAVACRIDRLDSDRTAAGRAAVGHVGSG